MLQLFRYWKENLRLIEIILNLCNGNVCIKYGSIGDHQFKLNLVNTSSLAFMYFVDLKCNSYDLFSVIFMPVHLY